MPFFDADHAGRNPPSAPSHPTGIMNSATSIPITSSMTMWPGSVRLQHSSATVLLVLEELADAKLRYPNAKVVIHPEARRELLSEADFVSSTSAMVQIAESHDQLIIGTERGLVDRAQLPVLQRVRLALLEAAALLLAADAEPELHQMHAAAHEVAFELRPDYFSLQDTDGYLWRATTVQRDVERIERSGTPPGPQQPQALAVSRGDDPSRQRGRVSNPR